MVHEGDTCNSGHYFTFARDSDGASPSIGSGGGVHGGGGHGAAAAAAAPGWHCYDDSNVAAVGAAQLTAVLAGGYRRFPAPWPPATPYLVCYRFRGGGPGGDHGGGLGQRALLHCRTSEAEAKAEAGAGTGDAAAAESPRGPLRGPSARLGAAELQAKEAAEPERFAKRPPARDQVTTAGFVKRH